MAEISSGESSHKKGSSKPKRKKLSTSVDMTPMVDLGFLLITFFILTTTLVTPQTMQISVPSKKNTDTPPKLKESLAITILIGKNDVVYYFFGVPSQEKEPEVIKSNYSKDGLQKMLLERNARVHRNVQILEERAKNRQITEDEFKKQAAKERADKDSPMVIIKATDGSTYNNLVSVLDEMNICNIGRYAIVDISAYDLNLLQKAGESLSEEELALIAGL